MRKFLFILLILPAVLAIGHDVYIFAQNPEKGFRMWDLGALWDKYHKESHDQWKHQIQAISQTVDSLNPIAGQTQTNTDTGQAYQEGFTQTTDEKGTNIVAPLVEETTVKKQASGLQKTIGFILEQPAAAVFLVLAVLIAFLYIVFNRLFGEKTGMNKVTHYKKMKKLQKKMKSS